MEGVHLVRRVLTAAIAALTLTTAGTMLTGAPAQAALGPACRHGRAATRRPGLGDSYFPDYGNGGYDVSHYDVRLRYDPATDRLTGTTTILATATQDLSRVQPGLPARRRVGAGQRLGRPAPPGRATTSWWSPRPARSPGASS